MPFTDRVRIHVKGGDGGDGCLSFRREANTPRGGPDGGDGGRGGSVLLEVDDRARDLSHYRGAVHHRAERGHQGQGGKKRGAAGRDLVLTVPPGTRVVRDGEAIADLAGPGERVQVARGGDGGVGNRAFRSSTNRAPRTTVPGSTGEATWITLELRLPVDVAIVGLPNAGKSALLNALTGASAPVEAYPQSTREPAFGPLASQDEARLFNVADLPGLAGDGTPRPDGHLEQLERAAVVLHLLDAADPESAEARLTRARAGLEPFLQHEPRVVTVAMGCPPAECPEWAEVAVDADSGEGIEELRAVVLGVLGAS
ncbi:MAG: GTPase [Miltoncostaeaceae bacterium]